MKVFLEDHSAKSIDRPEFKKFLAFIKANKGKIDTLLFTTWDRFSRNITESYRMIQLLLRYGVKASAIEQPLNLSILENKAMLAIFLVLPEIDNDRRSIKILGGIRGARKAGRWTCPAPFGYKNGRDEQNKPLLIPNEDAHMVRYAFNQIASGRSLIETRKAISRKGRHISKSSFSNLMRSAIYKGMVFVPAGDEQPAYLTKGVHEPIISDELFEYVQNVLTGRNIKANKPSYCAKREELPLRGILICSKCGARITGSPPRSHTGKQHFYYHCNYCSKERFKSQLANETK